MTGLLDRAGIATAMRDVDTVIHLAARVHMMRETSASPLTEFRRVNVEGTRVLLEEAIRASVRRFVFASSVKAMGEATVSPWTEETVPAPADPYGISKWEAEQVVRELAGRAGMHAPILRFPLMYGEGMKANMPRLFQLVDRGVPLPFGRVRNRRSLLYVGNAVAAIRAVLETPEASGETFLVSDGHDLSTPDLIREIARALGRPARLVPVPLSAFRTAGRFGDVIARFGPSLLTSAYVERLLGSLAVDASKLHRVTGFVPPFPLPAAMGRTAEWYRSSSTRGGSA